MANPKPFVIEDGESHKILVDGIGSAADSGATLHTRIAHPHHLYPHLNQCVQAMVNKFPQQDLESLLSALEANQMQPEQIQLFARLGAAAKHELNYVYLNLNQAAGQETRQEGSDHLRDALVDKQRHELNNILTGLLNNLSAGWQVFKNVLRDAGRTDLLPPPVKETSANTGGPVL